MTLIHERSTYYFLALHILSIFCVLGFEPIRVVPSIPCLCKSVSMPELSRTKVARSKPWSLQDVRELKRLAGPEASRRTKRKPVRGA